MIEKVHKLLKALLCKVESYTYRVESLEDCCNGMDYDYIRRDGDSMRGPLRFEQGVFFDDLSSTFNGNLDIGELTENVTWTLPGSSGTIALLDDLFTCEDLENCQEIIDIKDSVNYLYEKFDWALDFLDQQVLDTFSPFDNWSIDSVMNVNSSPSIFIEVAGSPYVLGTPIYVGQPFKVTVSSPGVITLKCTQI